MHLLIHACMHVNPIISTPTNNFIINLQLPHCLITIYKNYINHQQRGALQWWQHHLWVNAREDRKWPLCCRWKCLPLLFSGLFIFFVGAKFLEEVDGDLFSWFKCGHWRRRKKNSMIGKWRSRIKRGWILGVTYVFIYIYIIFSSIHLWMQRVFSRDVNGWYMHYK